MGTLYYLIDTGILGLIVGSFLNVVVYRLPIMLNREWQREYELYARAKADQPILTDGNAATFNLLTPRSHCPTCQKSVPIWTNVPLIGYLILKGKCANCRHSIPFRYPLIELLTALISIVVVQHFGLQWQSISALALSWILIILAAIDVDHQLLPDVMTLPLLWLGLAVNLWALHTPIQEAVMGAMAGYLSLWAVTKLYKIIRNREGMGQGDCKLLAALGAWLGWQPLAAIILIASLLGLVASLGLMAKAEGRYRHLCIPFGPYLSLAGWIMLLWGENVLNAYWQFIPVVSKLL